MKWYGPWRTFQSGQSPLSTKVDNKIIIDDAILKCNTNRISAIDHNSSNTLDRISIDTERRRNNGTGLFVRIICCYLVALLFAGIIAYFIMTNRSDKTTLSFAVDDENVTNEERLVMTNEFISI